MPQFHNIPAELQSLKQWVISRSVEDKIPRNPRTGQVASVTDPSTWGTFQEAIQSGANQIGFVLTPWDPYTIVDLDNKPSNPCTPEQLELHRKILQALPSYSEISTSGNGCHIIVKATIPASVHRDNVEIYSHSRYMICTGQVINNYPIADCQGIIDNMYSQMYVESTRATLVDEEEQLSDDEVVEMAYEAQNSHKFDALCKGEWLELGYPSQSEADLALISMLTFYSNSNEQVKRIFRLTELGQRDKAVKNDKYLNYAIGRCRASQAQPVEIERLAESVDNFVNQITTSNVAPVNHAQPVQQKPILPAGVDSDEIPFPPGLVGEMAEYIYQTSVRPVRKIALAAAISLMAGIVGRSYNFSNTGLNQYLIILATTGIGKDAVHTGINGLITAVSEKVPSVHNFMGPSAYSSGQSLIRVLDEKKCYVSVIGEFGVLLSRITDVRANAADKTFKKVVLDLYNRSGWNQWLQSSVYADAEKNTKQVRAPALTILGESTPEEFFGALTTRHIADGLVPRFMLIQYKGKRPPRNRNAGFPPNEILVDKLVEVVSRAITSDAQNINTPVGIEPGALALLDEFDEQADAMVNDDEADVASKQLWNRAHLKALKLAALIAVGYNHHNPIITREFAQWSIDLVRRDINTMMANFTSGLMAGDEVRREQLVIEACQAYINMDYRKRLTYIKNTALAKLNVVPVGFLRRRLRNVADFADAGDTGRALDNAIKALVQMGDLKQVGQPDLIAQGIKVRTEAYVLVTKFD